MSTNSTSDESALEGFKLYHYDPSLPAAIIFAILFLAVTVRHCQILFREKTWAFIPFVVGCVFECVGYGTRAYSATESPDWELMPFIMQSFFILLGPAFYAASIYMILGRLIRFLEGQDYSLISVKWLTKIFLLGDILSIISQGGGGGLLASGSDKSTQDLGNTIIIVGLGVQVVFFSGFMIVTGVFHIRISMRPTLKSKTTAAPWQAFIWVLYLTSALIMVRSVFRMVEYAQGHDGHLISNEAYLYVLDALLMFVVAVIFTVRHPSAVFAHEALCDPLEASAGSSDNIPMVSGRRWDRLD